MGVEQGTIGIITNSSATITQREAAELGIISTDFYLHSENTGENFTDSTLPPQDLYIRQQDRSHYEDGEIFSSSQPTPKDFLKTYEDNYKEGKKDILVISISSALSGTANSASIGAEMAKAKYPDINIHIIDTETFCLAQREIVFLALDLIKEGKPIEEIVPKLEERVGKDTLYAYGNKYTFAFLGKSGRVSDGTGRLEKYSGKLFGKNGRISQKLDKFKGIAKEAVARTASNLSLLPIVLFPDKDTRKVKLVNRLARKSADAKHAILDLINKDIEIRGQNNEKLLKWGIAYTGDESRGQDLKEFLYNELPDLRDIPFIGIREAGSVLGVHAGPGLSAMVAIWD